MNIGFFLAKGAATSLGAPVARQLRGGGSTQPGGTRGQEPPAPMGPPAPPAPWQNVHSFAPFQSFFPLCPSHPFLLPPHWILK